MEAQRELGKEQKAFSELEVTLGRHFDFLSLQNTLQGFVKSLANHNRHLAYLLNQRGAEEFSPAKLRARNL